MHASNRTQHNDFYKTTPKAIMAAVFEPFHYYIHASHDYAYKEDDQEDKDKTLKGLRVAPLITGPGVRCELPDCSLQLTPDGNG